MYRSLFPRDLFAEFDRLQRDMSGLFEPSPSIRGLGRGGYPALNVGSTATGVEVFAFAPGIDVVEASQVKGLEFDYVVIVDASARWWPDTPHHRRLLHVAATRAVHQLLITIIGAPSSLLPQARRP